VYIHQANATTYLINYLEFNYKSGREGREKALDKSYARRMTRSLHKRPAGRPRGVPRKNPPWDQKWASGRQMYTHSLHIASHIAVTHSLHIAGHFNKNKVLRSWPLLRSWRHPPRPLGQTSTNELHECVFVRIWLVCTYLLVKTRINQLH
jgi:hypothetical protein